MTRSGFNVTYQLPEPGKSWADVPSALKRMEMFGDVCGEKEKRNALEASSAAGTPL
jgi:hypothetical protein